MHAYTIENICWRSRPLDKQAIAVAADKVSLALLPRLFSRGHWAGLSDRAWMASPAEPAIRGPAGGLDQGPRHGGGAGAAATAYTTWETYRALPLPDRPYNEKDVKVKDEDAGHLLTGPLHADVCGVWSALAGAGGHPEASRAVGRGRHGQI